VCGERGHPLFDFPDLELRREHSIGHLRETLQCKSCGATLRHRTLAAALLRVVSTRSKRQITAIRDIDASALHGLRILDTDAFSPISERLKQLPDYIVSSFRPDLPFDTEIEPGYFNVNLENMGFESASIDIVLTSDVMEHVRGVDNAHREISRILKTGGCYIFTVPYDPSIAGHKILVDTSGAEDVFLVPPQYHGDPLSGGILAYRVFGKQLFADLQDCKLRADFVCIDDPAALIIKGDVFIAEKFAVPTVAQIPIA
jgi:SAM-dependent methyltransferase